MYNRLCSVDVSNGTTSTTAKPGFDIKVGVGTPQKKEFEYQGTSFSVFLVTKDGSYVSLASGDITQTEANCYALTTFDREYGTVSHPQLFRSGSGLQDYSHAIGMRVTLSDKVQPGSYLTITGSSRYYKSVTWRADPTLYVNFSYNINLDGTDFQAAAEPTFDWLKPNEMKMTLSASNLSDLDKSQTVNSSETTRLGLRNNGVEERKVSTKYKITVETKQNDGSYKTLKSYPEYVEGTSPKDIIINVPTDKEFRIKTIRETTCALAVKNAYYRNGTWTTSTRTVKQTKTIESTHAFNNVPVSITSSFNQVSGNVVLSWNQEKSIPKNSRLYVYRTELNSDGSYAGNREEAGYTTSKNFSDNVSRGMKWCTNYRYEVVMMLDSWRQAGYEIPTDPSPLENCNYSEHFINTTPKLDFHLSQDMDETEKIKMEWDYNNIPDSQNELTFRVHRLDKNGKLEQDYGSVKARRKDGHASFTDDKPSSNCEVYRYVVQLDLFDGAGQFLSDTLTARITASTTITEMLVTKGNLSNGARVTWKVNQVGTDPSLFVLKRRFVGTTEWLELYRISGSENEYTYLDTNTEPGRYYEYCVDVYGTKCEDDDAPLLSDSRIESGFGQSMGVITGRVSFDTGTAVPDARINLERSDDEESGHTYYFARHFQEAGEGLTWDGDEQYVKDMLSNKKDWSMQMWVRPDNVQSTNKASLFEVPNAFRLYLEKATSEANTFDLKCEWTDSKAWKSITLYNDIPSNEYNQYTFVHRKDSIYFYLNNELKSENAVMLSGTQSLDPVNDSYHGEALHFGGSADPSTESFTGYIDEVRIWSKALTKKDITNTFNRMLSGREDDLKLYWPFDEGLDKYSYDISRTSGIPNGNHPTMGATTVSDVIPSATQLCLYGVTNESGEYTIRGIPFTGSGTGYTVRPELGTHKFSPDNRIGFISPGSMTLNSYDFTDISSFKVSGIIYYEGTDIPVDSVQFAVDGTVCMNDGSIVMSNSNGEYTISVPIGPHVITASRMGHTFVNNGRYPELKGTTFDFRSEQTINFTDNTLAHFGGRITGGEVESKKELGYGLSVNTIGQATLELEALDYPQCRLNVLEKVTGLTSEIVNNPENLAVDSYSELVESESWRAGGDENAMKHIYIKTDPKTGEFSAKLPPLRYRITSLKFEHNPDLNNADVFQNLPVVDMADIIKKAPCDTLWNDDKTDYATLFHCNRAMKLTYRSNPEFEVTQVGLDKGIFGEESVTLTNIQNQKVEVPLYTVGADNKVTYNYGYPIFEQDRTYDFQVRLYESYVNYDEDNDGKRYEYALADSVITITNEMGEKVRIAAQDAVISDSIKVAKGDIVQLQNNQLKLDSLGTAKYRWLAGFPNLAPPFTRAMNIFTKVGGKTYGWQSEAFYGVVFGSITTGNNFVTTGPDNVVMVLRDPPGGSSSAYWQNDSISVDSWDFTGSIGTTDGSTWKNTEGGESEFWAGIATIQKISEAKVTFKSEHGFEITAETALGTGSTTTITNTEKITTNASSSYVGEEGDVFIGYSKNYLFGGADIVTLYPQTDGTYKIDMKRGMTVGDKFNTSFRFTQKYIEKELIPNLKKLRNDKLTYISDMNLIPVKVDEPKYFTTLTPDDPRYGSSNDDTKVWGDKAALPDDSDNGPSYWIRVPDDYEGVDSVYFFNNSIEAWTDRLRDNEEDKVKAFNDTKYFKQNFSWDRGTTETKSVTRSEKSQTNETITWKQKIFSKQEAGIDGTIATVKASIYTVLSLDLHYSLVSKWTQSSENKETFSYTLADNTKSSSLSVDVFDSPRGWSPIFRTRGGQTRCPYEDQTVTKYYKPGTVLNYATMKIENPKISIPTPVITGIPSGREANLEIDLTNESQTGEVNLPDLVVLNNPHGLVVTMDGLPLASGVSIPIYAGATNKKTLTIRQSDTSVLEYKDIKVALRSSCEPAKNFDEATFSISFTEAAPEADIAVNKTVINGYDVDNAPDSYLTVTAKNYNPQINGFKSIRMKYRFIGDNNWITAHEFFNGMSMAPASGLQEGQSLLPAGKSSVSHSFSLPLIDGHYMVCIETTSKFGDDKEVSWQSEEIEVVKDTHGPMLLGQAYPNTGILRPNSDIYIRFNEPIRSNYLTKAKNFSIFGNLNESPIDHLVSLQLNGNPVSTDSYLPFSNSSFSTSMWLYRQSGGSILKHGTANDFIELSTDADGAATLTINGETFTGSAARIPENEWVFLAAEYNHTALGDFFNADVSTTGETLTLFDNVPVPEYDNFGQLSIGEGLKGAIHDLAVWSNDMTPAQMRDYMWKSIPAHKLGLAGYWRMDEGHGTVVTDHARGHNIYLGNESWNLNNKNVAAKLDGKGYIKLDVATEAVSNEDNYLMMMWFRGEKDSNANTSLISMTDRMSIDFDSNNALVLRTYRNSSSLDSNGESTTLSDVDYSDGNWHHLALNVRRGTSANVYIDGKAVKTINETEIPAFAASSVFIGGRERNVGNSLKVADLFTGDVDEFTIWKATVDGTSIAESRYFQCDSTLNMLLVYYPMEHKYRDGSGVIQTEFSLASGKKSTTGQLFTAEGPNVTQAITAPPLKTMSTYENIDFDFIASDNEIYITLKTLPSRLQDNLISFTVHDVPDINGNTSDAITWTAKADYSALFWRMEYSGEYYMDRSYPISIEATLANMSSESATYKLSGLPSWITADKMEGVIDVDESEKITFHIAPNAPLGTNVPIIYATDQNGINVALPLYITVFGNEPKWECETANYESSMNMIGQIYIKDKICSQNWSRIYAFIGDECRGIASPQLMTSRDAYFTNMVVYGSSKDDGKPVTFRVYDSEKGVVYSDIITTLNGEEQNITFTTNKLVGDYNTPVKWSATQTIEQILDLKYSWNWISLCVQPFSGHESPAEVLGTNSAFFCVKDKSEGASFLKSGEWKGSLTGMYPGQMYKVRMASELPDKTIRGTYINPRTNTLTIYPDWNWIGSLSIFSLSLNEAFADLNPAIGDVVKTKQDVAFYDGTRWEGTLQSINPGQGYMYQSKAKVAKSFRFPEVENLMMANRATFLTDESTWWPFESADHHSFSDNMIVVATLSDGTVPVDTACVGAFIDNECRGVTRAIDGIYYLTVSANAEESGKKIEFRTYYDGEVRHIMETSVYLSDDIEGDPSEPKLLTIGNGLGVDEIAYDGIHVAPTRTQRMVYVRSEHPLRSVEVYSTSGALMKTGVADGNRCDLDLLSLVDGIYIIKVTDNAGNQCVKRIIKVQKSE